jgi:hypothetical protein
MKNINLKLKALGIFLLVFSSLLAFIISSIQASPNTELGGVFSFAIPIISCLFFIILYLIGNIINKWIGLSLLLLGAVANIIIGYLLIMAMMNP